jgi:hypothetical protein
VVIVFNFPHSQEPNLKHSTKPLYRLQAAQAEYQRLIHAAKTRAQSANSLAETERARARVAHLERELARRNEQEAKEAAEKERQERVAERQQAAEQLKVSVPQRLLL